MRQLAWVMPEFVKDMEDKEKEFKLLGRDLSELDDYLIVEEEVFALIDADHRGTLRIDRNDTSRLHMLGEAMKGGRVFIGDAREKTERTFVQSSWIQYVHCIVVQHDWHKVMGPAIAAAEGDDFRLPYDECCFEFLVNGFPILFLCGSPESEYNSSGVVKHAVFLYAPKCREWTVVKPDESLAMWLWGHVKAISVALESEVVEEEMIRAPIALNNKREKKGKPPVSDHHLVRLAQRHRSFQSPGTGTHRSPRLHFRRGHWRHYDTHKTWIKWTLVGDPELGIVTKDYIA